MSLICQLGIYFHVFSWLLRTIFDYEHFGFMTFISLVTFLAISLEISDNIVDFEHFRNYDYFGFLDGFLIKTFSVHFITFGCLEV